MATAASTFERLRAHVSGEVSREVPLAPRTSVRAGGSAELFIQPTDANDLAQVLQILAEDDQPFALLGGGADTLVGDGGVRGAVIRLPGSGAAQVIPGEGGVSVTLAGGAPIARLISAMRKHGATGAEFLAGVPGTIGGAVAMNAGTREGWVQSCLSGVELVSAKGTQALTRDALRFEYRHTHLPPGSVIHSARFWLPFGDVTASEAQMAGDLAKRRATQPLNLPNFGSSFVNPPGASAGRLIEEAGLKGFRVGQAQISPVHANFMVNLGGARARDLRALLDKARSEVLERTGIALAHEVKFVGEF